TLPGVFVGLLLGGATPLQAGIAQLLVLVALLAAEAAAAALTVELVWRACWDGARFRLPEPAAPTGVVGPRGFRRIGRRG
nr:ABC transporter permease [Geodermatophilaceae bacterium]